MNCEFLTLTARRLVLIVGLLVPLLTPACASTPEHVERAFTAARAAWAVARPFADAILDAAAADGSLSAPQLAAVRQAEAAVADALAQKSVSDAALAAWKSAEPVALQQLDRLEAAGKLTKSQATKSRLAILFFGAALQVLADELSTPPSPDS